MARPIQMALTCVGITTSRFESRFVSSEIHVNKLQKATTNDEMNIMVRVARVGKVHLPINRFKGVDQLHRNSGSRRAADISQGFVHIL